MKSLAKSLGMLVCAVTMTTISLGAAAAHASSPVVPSPQIETVAEETQQVGTPKSATGATDAERYGAREQNAKGLDEFRGGSASIYIGGSAVTVLLVVLLVVIIL